MSVTLLLAVLALVLVVSTERLRLDKVLHRLLLEGRWVGGGGGGGGGGEESELMETGAVCQ